MLVGSGVLAISQLYTFRTVAAFAPAVCFHTSAGRPVRHRQRRGLIDVNRLYDYKTLQLDEDEPDVPVKGSFTRRPFGDANQPVNASADGGCSDEPISLPFNPYSKEPRKCILCKHNIKLDYKNTRLLQQFVSSFSGRIYERHVTGLCKEQQAAVVQTIALSRKAGLMPILTKDPKFLNDPKLFDPLRPISQHSYD